MTWALLSLFNWWKLKPETWCETENLGPIVRDLAGTQTQPLAPEWWSSHHGSRASPHQRPRCKCILLTGFQPVQGAGRELKKQGWLHFFLTIFHSGKVITVPSSRHWVVFAAHCWSDWLRRSVSREPGGTLGSGEVDTELDNGNRDGFTHSFDRVRYPAQRDDCTIW